jgi:2,3-bisphosphoglycerate-dependent phosphoglycerate mutase
MYKIVFIRHGESTWNRDNRFTGWADIDITELGADQARQAVKLLKAAGYAFDIAYTSVMKRAIRTQWLISEEMDQMWIPVVTDWRLNECHYGALTGLDKAEVAKEYGEEQVRVWRHSYHVQPPTLTPDDERASYNDPRYAHLKREDIPLTECLKDTVARIIPLWNDRIVPDMKAGKRIIVTGHNHSLRALIKHVCDLTENEISDLDIPNALPIVYEFDHDLNPLSYQLITE